MTSVVESLPVLILHAHNRCNCRCLMCDIWKNTDGGELRATEVERYLDDLQSLSVRWIVLSGGEPLMHSNFAELCRPIRRRNIRLTLLTTGLLLERAASHVLESVDDVIVSLDGPQPVHDRIRRVPGAYAALERGVNALHRQRPAFPVSARCTVQRENHAVLNAAAHAAQNLGLTSISFLAADVTSEAFNRFPLWNPERQSQVALSPAEITVLQQQVRELVHDWNGTGFIAESEEKLKRIVRHFQSHLDFCEPVAPRCNAPWVSAVVETDGAVRPCFFHPPVGSTRNRSLLEVLNGPEAVHFRETLDVASNPTCRKCVCSLNWKS